MERDSQSQEISVPKDLTLQTRQRIISWWTQSEKEMTSVRIHCAGCVPNCPVAEMLLNVDRREL